MDHIKKHAEDLKEAFGKPRNGFEEYVKQCENVYVPTKVPEFCKWWRTPEKEILHDIMLQPFYDSRTLKADNRDILVVSYPKTGTTWTQEITYLVVNDANVEKAKSLPTEFRFPFLEVPVCGIRGIEKMEGQRLIKSHLPYHLLPSSFTENKSKIIYITRNPKDTVVSYFHFLKMVGYNGYNGTFEEFVDLFCEEKLMYSSFAKNVLSYWERRNDDNILFLFYEELQADLKANVLKIAKFLGKSLTDDQIDTIVCHTSFNEMKNNPMANYSHGGAAIKMPDSITDFLRKGKSGDWRNYFTVDLNKKVDNYVQKYFAESDIVFDYGDRDFIA